MDECRFIADQRDKYHSSVPIDGNYETINVLQFFPNNFFHSQSQVISPPSINNSKELHPLEIDIQKSIRSQNQSVIQTAKQHISVQDTTDGNENSFDTQHIIWRNNEIFSDNDNNQPEHRDDGIALQSDIPLTVQFCIDSDSAKKNEVSTDEESQLPTPVFDHEPDPDNEINVSENDSDVKNKCYMCFKRFRQKKNMYAHIRKIHSLQPKIEGGIICPMCEMHSLRHEHLRHHLESLHSIKIQKEEKIFTSMEDFNEWKAREEKETFSYFVSKGSSKLLAGIQTKSYFKCHRSGACPLKSETRKRKPKKQGSYKIGVTCPAAMEVTENVHGILVTYWSTHIGHSILSGTSDGLRVQGLLGSGMLWDQVLDLVHHESEEKTIVPNKKERSSVVIDKKAAPLGKKPKSQKLVKSVPQSTLIEKTDRLLSFLETTEVTASFRPLISNMIDNLTSIVKRRSIENKQENNVKTVIQGTYPSNLEKSNITSGQKETRVMRRKNTIKLKKT